MKLRWLLARKRHHASLVNAKFFEPWPGFIFLHALILFSLLGFFGLWFFIGEQLVELVAASVLVALWTWVSAAFWRLYWHRAPSRIKKLEASIEALSSQPLPEKAAPHV